MLRSIRHSVTACLLCLPGLGALAQANGLKLSVDYAHRLLSYDGPGGSRFFTGATAIGLGYERDLTQRIGFGVELRYVGGEDGKGYEALYNARYFTSDNGYTAFYLGTFLGVQRAHGTYSTRTITTGGIVMYDEKSYAHLQMPVGLRMGVRGGLEGFFAEAFFQVGYAIGAGGEEYPGSSYSYDPLFVGLGFSIGAGWE